MTHLVKIPNYFKGSEGEPLEFEHKKHVKYFKLCLRQYPQQAQKEDVSRMVGYLQRFHYSIKAHNSKKVFKIVKDVIIILILPKICKQLLYHHYFCASDCKMNYLLINCLYISVYLNSLVLINYLSMNYLSKNQHIGVNIPGRLSPQTQLILLSVSYIT